MTLLPGVRTIDRHGKNFQEDSKLAMQQIYNNTYLNVTLSEVYILPKTLNPDKIDPITKLPETPILTFDEFIASDSTATGNEEQGETLEEVEIYEYQLMNKQLDYLRSTYPTRDSFKGLAVPGVLGEPVITCDNSEFTKKDLDNNNNKPRMGFIYTLPVYDLSGNFSGAISGVVRLNTIEKLLPKGDYALVNNAYKYYGANDANPSLTDSQKHFQNGKTNPNLIYSNLTKLQVVDNMPWELWSVASNDEFLSLATVKQANTIFYAGIVVSLLAAMGLGSAVRSSQSSQARLEAKVKEKTKELSARNDDMRLILDNAEEGFLTCSLEGTIGNEYSAIVEKWFTKPTDDMKIWDLIMADEPKRLGYFKGGWSQLIDDFMPFEVCAGQMPSIVKNGKSTYELSFTPIHDHEDKLRSILVVVMDVTARIEAEAKERQQQELVATFQALSKDRAGFLEFFADSENIVHTLVNETIEKDLQFRMIHTLKGNSAQYGLATIAEVCHVMESKLNEQSNPLPKEDISLIATTWSQTTARLIELVGNRTRKSIELDVAEYAFVLQRIKEGADHKEIVNLIEKWRLEPTSKRLNSIADRTQTLCDRLNLINVQITTKSNDVRLEPEAFSEVWSSLVHIIRNAVDHGLVDAPSEQPAIHFETKIEDHHLKISIKDNGNGIDWDRVRQKARGLALPAETTEDLIACLFEDGFSTKDSVSSVSGRGVGMAAVKAAIVEAKGSIDVHSKLGSGTEFIISLPLQGHDPKLQVHQQKTA